MYLDCHLHGMFRHTSDRTPNILESSLPKSMFNVSTIAVCLLLQGILDQLTGSVVEVKQCLACGQQKDQHITECNSLITQVPQSTMTIEGALQQTFEAELMDDPEYLCRSVGKECFLA